MKGAPFSMEGMRKGYLSDQKWCIKRGRVHMDPGVGRGGGGEEPRV